MLRDALPRGWYGCAASRERFGYLCSSQFAASLYEKFVGGSWVQADRGIPWHTTKSGRTSCRTGAGTQANLLTEWLQERRAEPIQSDSVSSTDQWQAWGNSVLEGATKLLLWLLKMRLFVFLNHSPIICLICNFFQSAHLGFIANWVSILVLVYSWLASNWN